MPANFLLTEDRHLEEALALVEAISDYEGLSQVQELVFREAWRDKPYRTHLTSLRSCKPLDHEPNKAKIELRGRIR